MAGNKTRLPKRANIPRGWGELAPHGANTPQMFDRWRVLCALRRYDPRILETLAAEPYAAYIVASGTGVVGSLDTFDDLADGTLRTALTAWSRNWTGYAVKWMVDAALYTMSVWSRSTAPTSSASKALDWAMPPLPIPATTGDFDPFTESISRFRNRTSRYSASVESEIADKTNTARANGATLTPTERAPLIFTVEPDGAGGWRDRGPDAVLVEWRKRDPYAWFAMLVLDNDHSTGKIAHLIDGTPHPDERMNLRPDDGRPGYKPPSDRDRCRTCNSTRPKVGKAVRAIAERVDWPLPRRVNQHV